MTLAVRCLLSVVCYVSTSVCCVLVVVCCPFSLCVVLFVISSL